MEPSALAMLAALEPEASLARRLLRQQSHQATAAGQVWRGRIGPHRVILVRCGMGAERAAAALHWLLEREALQGVLSLGFAGGLQPGLNTGDVVLAERLQAAPADDCPEMAVVEPDARWAALATAAAQRADLSWRRGSLVSGEMVVSSASDKMRLGRETGALAVDMESYRTASIAAARQLSFAAMRVILDPCDLQLDLPPDGFTTPDGGVRPGAAALAVMRQPRLLASFGRLWRRSGLAQRQLAAWLEHFIDLLDAAPGQEDGESP